MWNLLQLLSMVLHMHRTGKTKENYIVIPDLTLSQIAFTALNRVSGLCHVHFSQSFGKHCSYHLHGL